jgi:HAD superfamily hydrolase (TIGR01509 family)
MKPLVIFDCDGVLVDSETIASTVFAEHLLEAGFPYTSLRCREQFTGLSLASCRQLIEAEHGRQLPQDFFEHLQSTTFARFAGNLQPVAGVVEVLEYIKRLQWDTCIASSGSHDKMAHTLGITGLKPFFANRIFSASEVPRGKPAPDLFLHAAASLGFEPEACIVIEDSLPGVQAAVAAGMKVCAFGTIPDGYPDAQVFTAMSELPSILLSIQACFLRRQG